MSSTRPKPGDGRFAGLPRFKIEQYKTLGMVNPHRVAVRQPHEETTTYEDPQEKPGLARFRKS